MAFWSIAFLGSTAIGGPIVGWVGEHTFPQWGLGLGGVAALVAAMIGFITLRNAKRQPQISEATIQTREYKPEMIQH